MVDDHDDGGQSNPRMFTVLTLFVHIVDSNILPFRKTPWFKWMMIMMLFLNLIVLFSKILKDNWFTFSQQSNKRKFCVTMLFFDFSSPMLFLDFDWLNWINTVFLFRGVEEKERKHDEWSPSILDLIDLGTMNRITSCVCLCSCSRFRVEYLECHNTQRPR